jgi:6-pyruvoyltetrahydropterin/6-carboxytetrahydropterin synthase
MYRSIKTYGNERGLSCAFRQWRADSHCNLIHGYSLGFRITFEAADLDERNWVYDFGDCKWIKKYLDEVFDHTLAIAEDDPELKVFKGLEKFNLANVVVLKDVGCEKFAEHVHNYISSKVYNDTGGRVSVYSVEVFEHGANSAIYINPYGSSV